MSAPLTMINKGENMSVLAQLYTKVYVICPCCSGESGHTVSQLFNTGYREFGPWQCVICRGTFKGHVTAENHTYAEVTTVTKDQMRQYGFTEAKAKQRESRFSAD